MRIFLPLACGPPSAIQRPVKGLRKLFLFSKTIQGEGCLLSIYWEIPYCTYVNAHAYNLESGCRYRILKQRHHPQKESTTKRKPEIATKKQLIS